MKISNYLIKTPVAAVVFFAYFQGAQAAALDVSQKPLVLVDSVAPNLIVTLDDSGSMWRAAVPDNLGGRHDRRGKSAAWNPLYYNPAISYEIPKGLDTSGNVVSFDTTFTQAWHNGFDTSQGSVDLSTNYKVDWYCDHNNFTNCTYSSGSIGGQLGRNPALDFGGSPPELVSRDWGRCADGYPYESGGFTYSCENIGSGRNRYHEVYRVATGASDRTETGVPAYYYQLVTGCATGSSNEDCYTKVDVSASSGVGGADERKNFAIWYSFYRDRGLATISAAHLAFYTLPDDMRLTWQALNRCTALNSSQSACIDNKFRRINEEHKGNFYTWLRNITFGSGTPLRGALSNAGEFLKGNDAWAFNPNPFTGSTVTTPEYACRASYHIMMTDGIWNGNGTIAAPARADDQAFTLPDGTAYNGSRAPYADSATLTLADYAMHYWATDLRGGLDNDLKPYTRSSGATAAETFWDPRNNPATWQSMSNFMVALGLGNALNKADIPWSGSTFEGTGYDNLVSGTASWPAASPNSNNNVYDLWHAAINSRGEFFSADSPEALTKAFKDILNRIAERQSTAAASGSSTSVSANDPSDPYGVTIVNRSFVPEYDSSDWSGDVERRDKGRDLGGVYTPPTVVWSARTRLNGVDESTRNIVMGGGAGLSGLQRFSYANLSDAQKATFNLNPDSASGAIDSKGADRVAYLRGSRALEGSADTDFRRRGSVLGDIINSSPVVEGAPSYLPYLADDIDGSDGDYAAFQLAHKGRPELVYVGANDGMLHAFFAGDTVDNQTGTTLAEGGKEAFAFVPKAVIDNLPKLTAQSYKGGAHQFFVDGTPVIRDVYINGEWRTVLVGTLRAGGKSIFALDVTDPGLDGSGVKLLWEITDQTAGYGNLGYTFPEPEIARLHSGEWGVLLGNGYDSVNDSASMFIINIADGSLIKEIPVESEPDTVNGLSSVRGADNNNDGIVDYAYAGDLRGNLWRFDLSKTISEEMDDPFDSDTAQSSVSSADFSVSYGGKPLYKAIYPAAAEDQRVQSITAIPSLVRHPTRRGYLVIFGTGKFFETDDASGDLEKANTVYAVWDRKTRAESTASAPTVSRADLQQQSITGELSRTFDDGDPATADPSWNVRTFSENLVQWYNDSTPRAEESDDTKVNQWGWYLDLRVQGEGLKGEMMLDRMYVSGDSLIFGTLTPNDDPCASGASYWAYVINARTGGRLSRPALDFNGDGRFDEGDTILGKPPGGFETDSPPTMGGDTFGGDKAPRVETDPALEGRQSWQVLPLDVAEGEEGQEP